MSKKSSLRKDLRAVYISKECHARFVAETKRKGLKLGFVAECLILAWSNRDADAVARTQLEIQMYLDHAALKAHDKRKKSKP